MLKAYIESYGCQMNRLDSELVMGALAADGYEQTASMSEADLILVNTCSVREHAENKVWSRLGLLRQPNHRKPGALLGVIGCMAQREQEVIFRRAPHVNLIVGPREVMEIPRLVRDVRDRQGKQRATALGLDGEFRYARDVAQRPEQHHAFINIMHGCDMRCTFCIVPFTRGAEQSRPLGDILDETERLVADGVREITLLGQTVNSYGKGLGVALAEAGVVVPTDGVGPGVSNVSPVRRHAGDPDLADLLEALNGVSGLHRIRYITSHPALFTPDFFRRIGALDKVCEALHAPAQSGSDRMLKRMKRLYTREAYLRFVDFARAAVPDLALASDFIVGFPGESDADFEETVSLIREVGFAQSFVFKYSERPGTPSTNLPDDVPDPEKKRRNNHLLDVQNEISETLNRELVGRQVEVLVAGPSKKDPSRLWGRTRGHRIVVLPPLPGPASPAPGELVVVPVERANATTLYAGAPVESSATALVPA